MKKKAFKLEPTVWGKIEIGRACLVPVMNGLAFQPCEKTAKTFKDGEVNEFNCFAEVQGVTVLVQIKDDEPVFVKVVNEI